MSLRRLIGMGLIRLGVRVGRFQDEIEEEAANLEPTLSTPRVDYGTVAQKMRDEGRRPIPKREEELEPPLKGSLEERFGRR